MTTRAIAPRRGAYAPASSNAGCASLMRPCAIPEWIFAATSSIRPSTLPSGSAPGITSPGSCSITSPLRPNRTWKSYSRWWACVTRRMRARSARPRLDTTAGRPMSNSTSTLLSCADGFSTTPTRLATENGPSVVLVGSSYASFSILSPSCSSSTASYASARPSIEPSRYTPIAWPAPPSNTVLYAPEPSTGPRKSAGSAGRAGSPSR
ncbi:hypothetical protein BME24068_06730 [Burkholderia metallica]|nr:hypothetical protein BME24068_06730 [Burkholderia metallica]